MVVGILGNRRRGFEEIVVGFSDGRWGSPDPQRFNCGSLTRADSISAFIPPHTNSEIRRDSVRIAVVMLAEVSD